MIRSVWLAVIFLVCICVLAAFKVSIATPSRQQAALADEVMDSDGALDVMAKADRLDDVPDKKPVQSVAIVVPKAVAEMEEGPPKIISRHWQDSNATIKKRKRYRHHASRTRHRRAHR